ncbi:3-keto-disaccharide hydrolase [Haloferula sp.]|uniref:3-keto-disaccharide hydrolase n=1 Tax=Haloferula sp. TaxID=2497595 RepID=UPI003C73A592
MKTLLFLFATLTLASSAETEPLDFLPIFNGKDLTGWSGEGYKVEDGAIVSSPEGRILESDYRFANYVLDFEFLLTEGANNGLGIHYPGTGDPAYSGMELQILDDRARKYEDLMPYQFHGSIYSMVPAKKGALKPLSEWNLQRVVVNGDEVKVELNGQLITKANLSELEKEFPKHLGVRRRSGHLALCGHGDKVYFRKLRICELPPAANSEGVRAAGFTPLSEGKGLDAWKVEPGSEGHWINFNGIIKYDGRSTADVKDLWSKESYGDFTLVFDWRWSKKGAMKPRPVIGPDGNETGENVEVEELDSGVFLRGSSKSQVNLWNWPAGSGEVYGYRTDKNQPAEVRAAATPKTKADKPLGEWNRTMITLKGDRLTVVLNDAVVIDNAQLPGIPAEGPIAFQHHGSAIDFANVWIRED